MSVGRTVGHDAVGDAHLVNVAAPPTAAGRGVHHVVVRLGALPAHVLTEEEVFLPVPVRREGQRVRKVIQKCEYRFAVLFPVGNGDVHHQHDEFVFRHEREVVLHEFKLCLAEAAMVAPGFRVPPDVVQRNEVHIAVVEAVVVRTEHARVGLVGLAGFRRVVVHVVVADHVVPRHAHEPERLGERVEHVEVVKHDVAHGRPKDDPLLLRQFLDDVMRDIVDLLLVARLRVAKQEHGERVTHVLAVQWKVDAFRQRPRRRYPRILQLGRAFRPVYIEELGQVRRRVHGRLVAGRLHHEDFAVARDRHRILAGGVRLHDVHTVRHGDTAQAALAGVPHAVGIGVHEDHARGVGAAVVGDGGLCRACGGLAADERHGGAAKQGQVSHGRSPPSVGPGFV